MGIPNHWQKKGKNETENAEGGQQQEKKQEETQGEKYEEKVLEGWPYH